MLAVDFTPILTLIIAIIPIVLLIGILTKFLKGKLFVMILLATLLVSAIAFPLFSGGMGFLAVSATGSLSPDSGTLMADIPTFFSAGGLTPSTAYSVNVSVGGSESIAISSATSSSDGDLSFSLTFTVEGSTTVEVIDNVTVIATGNFNIVNFIDLIMPYIILAVTLSVLFGVVGMLSGIVSMKK